MKTIATMALKPGMVLAEDVLSYKNELLLSRNTTLDDIAIAKISRYSVMCVNIKEEADFATTHFEKVRVSEGFRRFEKSYSIYMAVYKKMIDNLINEDADIETETLYQIYGEITGCAKTGEILLDYLYNMLPTEDTVTYSHCMNSALVAGVFATWLGLPLKDQFTLIECGFLYDIGKFLLAPELVSKPDKLTDSEFERVKAHTIYGYHLIKNHGLDENVLKCTLQHHEMCNGTGYPKILKEDDINFYAKIISIVDAYCAMTSARSYRKTLIPLQVVANFEATSDRYSPALLKSILSHIANSQLGMTVRLSDGTMAEIILINQLKLSRPLVKCGDTLIDLTKRTDLEIVEVI
ncbi:MAG: HD domain-containing protein [Lachnospiraceae bacterium]|nr:HD domain-containing protein [Lachnospiraceae bacterium]